ncbi:hypothetical protein BUALT_Bualt15G0076000 [Buddleja alternifolia]|uniref:Uncharacterized protein n=1 Tax=Buddleja alternifolia TaxID=168488 RepID=A0AAV6WK05_9LAMI|nr:hypothetical protein BUALT_Bualt15G0076000 [Buddleja alternifolia]
MESRLTKLEIDAVLQLIQLSGKLTDDFEVFWVNFEAKKEEEEESSVVGESSSAILSWSLINNPEKSCLDDEALPRRKPKFGSLIDIYRKTSPFMNNRPQKRVRT